VAQPTTEQTCSGPVNSDRTSPRVRLMAAHWPKPTVVVAASPGSAEPAWSSFGLVHDTVGSNWSRRRSRPSNSQRHDPRLKASVRPWRPRHRGRRWPDRSSCVGDEEPHGGLGEDAAGVGNQFCGVARRKISPKRLAMEAHRRRREARSLNLVDGRGVQSLVA
jgi:hypothetical protein